MGCFPCLGHGIAGVEQKEAAVLMPLAVLLGASFYLLKQDVLRAASARISGNSEASLFDLKGWRRLGFHIGGAN
jgi:hypothetical protein